MPGKKSYSSSKSKAVDRSSDWSEWIWDAPNSQHYRTKLGPDGQYIYDYRLSEVQPSRETPRSQPSSSSGGNSDPAAYYGNSEYGYNDLANDLANTSITSQPVLISTHSNPYNTSQVNNYQDQQGQAESSRSFGAQPIPVQQGSYPVVSHGLSPYGGQQLNTSGFAQEHTVGYTRGVQDQGQSAYGASYGVGQTGGSNYYDSSITAREDTAYPATNTAGYQSQDAGEASGSGVRTPTVMANARYIQGTMGTEERLDPRFKLHNSRYFKPGQVFKVLWSEPRGETARGDSTDVTKFTLKTKHGETVHSSIRRFVIVAGDYGHCQCLPILTYQHQGTSKYGVQREHHAIIYTGSEPPQEIQGEARLEREPIRVIPKTPRDKLEPDSRINYAKIYTVEHNVKVKFVGWIADESKRTFLTDFDAVWAAKKQLFPQQDYVESYLGGALTTSRHSY